MTVTIPGCLHNYTCEVLVITGITVGRATQKRVSGHMRTAKALRLRGWAVLIETSLSANRIIENYGMYEWRAKARIILCACAGWSESAHFADVRRYFFAAHCDNKQHTSSFILMSVGNGWLTVLRSCITTQPWVVIIVDPHCKKGPVCSKHVRCLIRTTVARLQNFWTLQKAPMRMLWAHDRGAYRKKWVSMACHNDSFLSMRIKFRISYQVS